MDGLEGGERYINAERRQIRIRKREEWRKPIWDTDRRSNGRQMKGKDTVAGLEAGRERYINGEGKDGVEREGEGKNGGRGDGIMADGGKEEDNEGLERGRER